MNRFIEILNEKLIKNRNLGRKSLEAVLEDVKQVEAEYKADKVNQLAMMYAQNMADYGIDVTHKWETATSQSAALNEAYLRGLHDERKYQYMQMKNKGGWIPCSERLPEQTEKVLVITDKGCYYIARLNTQNEWVCYAEMINTKITFSKVTAWQPLPEAYKEGGAE